MNMRTLAAVAGVVAVVGFLPACGTSSSSGTTVTPVTPATPAPTPTPVATEPSHTPTPAPCGSCEAPVTNTNPPVRLTIRVYKVEDLNGVVLPRIPDSIPLGYKVTIDATPKDIDNRDTLGSGTVEFSFSDTSLVKVSSNHGFQKKLTVLGAGTIEVAASLDGIDSNVLTITLGD